MADGVDLKGWKIPSLPYLIWGPVDKQPAEKEIIAPSRTLLRRLESVNIGTDFWRGRAYWL